jgi:hypothetical protein
VTRWQGLRRTKFRQVNKDARRLTFAQQRQQHGAPIGKVLWRLKSHIEELHYPRAINCPPQRSSRLYTTGLCLNLVAVGNQIIGGLLDLIRR